MKKFLYTICLALVCCLLQGCSSEQTAILDEGVEASLETIGVNKRNIEDGKFSFGLDEVNFLLKVKNESEVTAKYSIGFVLTNTSKIPIEFSTDGTTWTNSITAPAEKSLAVGAPEDTITVQWRWAFNGTDSTNYQTTQNDVTDTTLGTAAQTAPAKITVTTTLTATQVN